MSLMNTQKPSTLPEDEVRAQRQVLAMLDSLDPQIAIAATTRFNVDRAKERVFTTNAKVLKEATQKLPGIKTFN